MTEKKLSSATMATSSSNSGSRVPNSVNVDSSDWDNIKAPTASQKLVKKSKEAPFVPIGV